MGAGSVAILRGGDVVAETDEHFAHASRAEEVLGVIRSLMEQTGVELGEIGSIAVSLGPGSYSGIRIGVSTAIGLKDGLGVECLGCSLLEAIASSASADRLVTAVPVGKNDVAWQQFENSNGTTRPLSPPTLVSAPEFCDALGELGRLSVRAPRSLLERVSSHSLNHAFETADDNSTLATLVGRYGFSYPTDKSLRPIYLRSGTGF